MAAKGEPQREHPPGARSRFQIAGHPLHPMLVTFPIAFFSGTLATDLLYWWTGNIMWAQFSFWLLVGGLLGGTAAAAAGFMDFILVPQIRRHFSSWSHMLTAILLMAVAAANFVLRIDEPARAIVPWGLFMSGWMMLMVGVAGWLGGKLVFEHNLGPAERQG
jgi:uncharacterized membrane protein